MAKMTKSEAITAARKMALNDDRIKAVTTDILANMDWTARRTAVDAITATSNVRFINTSEKYLPEAIEAFKTQALDMWYREEQHLKNASQGITTDQAKTKITDFLKSLNIRGAQISEYGDRIEVERGRCSAALYFRMERLEERITNPDNAGQSAGSYAIRVEYSTSGTTYSPAEMAVVVKIQGELLDAGNELTVLMSRERIVWTWGMDEAVAS
jgi:hypothetical protein